MHNPSNLVRHFWSEALIREWLTVLLGNVVRLAVGLASSVLIARSLGPENFGLYAVVTGLIAIGARICDAGLTNAAVKFIAPTTISQPAHSRQFAGAFLLVKISLATIGTLLGFALAPDLSAVILGNRNFAALVTLSSVGVLTTAVSNAMSTLLQTSRQFRVFVALQIFNPLLTLIAAAALAVSRTLSVRILLWVTILVPLLVAGAGWVKVTILFPNPKTESSGASSFSLRG